MARASLSLEPKKSSIPAVAYPWLIFGGLLLLLHATLLRLPYFWDELGQFIPASLDILYDNAWIPKSTLPNIHPPGVMAYLALVWRLFGYSIPATRIAMLMLADAGLVALFFLSVELCKPLRGSPALMPVVLTLASPLFFTQSMMAQLDMPAMVFTIAALVLFLKERFGWCVAACTLLVLVKETGALAPAFFLLWLAWERRWRQAALFLIPLIALGAWLAILAHRTGTIFGNREFEQYNLAFQMNPVRLVATLLRRLFFVFVDNFHFIGTLALIYAWRRFAIFRTRNWAICGGFAAAHIVAVSILGGAALERYLLPVLPLFYVAVAAAWTVVPELWRVRSSIALTAGLVLCLFLNPPWPFPFENNLAAVDFVKLQESAAEFVEANYSDRTIASAWPFPDALRRPEFGFVTRPMKVKGIEDFHRSSVLPLKGHIEVLVLYSRTWEPGTGVLRIPGVETFLRRYYYYEPQITKDEVQSQLGLLLVERYERRGQWIEVYADQASKSPEVVRLTAGVY